MDRLTEGWKHTLRVATSRLKICAMLTPFLRSAHQSHFANANANKEAEIITTVAATADTAADPAADTAAAAAAAEDASAYQHLVNDALRQIEEDIKILSA